VNSPKKEAGLGSDSRDVMFGAQLFDHLGRADSPPMTIDTAAGPAPWAKTTGPGTSAPTTTSPVPTPVPYSPTPVSFGAPSSLPRPGVAVSAPVMIEMSFTATVPALAPQPVKKASTLTNPWDMGHVCPCCWIAHQLKHQPSVAQGGYSRASLQQLARTLFKDDGAPASVRESIHMPLLKQKTEFKHKSYVVADSSGKFSDNLATASSPLKRNRNLVAGALPKLRTSSVVRPLSRAANDDSEDGFPRLGRPLSILRSTGNFILRETRTKKKGLSLLGGALAEMGKKPVKKEPLNLISLPGVRGRPTTAPALRPMRGAARHKLTRPRSSTRPRTVQRQLRTTSRSSSARSSRARRPSSHLDQFFSKDVPSSLPSFLSRTEYNDATAEWGL